MFDVRQVHEFFFHLFCECSSSACNQKKEVTAACFECCQIQVHRLSASFAVIFFV